MIAGWIERAGAACKRLGRALTAMQDKGGHNTFEDGCPPRPSPPAPMVRWRTRYDAPMRLGDGHLWSVCGVSCGCTIGECPYSMDHFIENQREHWAARREQAVRDHQSL